MCFTAHPHGCNNESWRAAAGAVQRAAPQAAARGFAAARSLTEEFHACAVLETLCPAKAPGS